MDKDSVSFIIGSLTKQIPEAIKRQCCDCKRDVWISPWNADKTPICFKCVTERTKDQPRYKMEITERDTQRAIEEIRKRAIKRKASRKWNMFN